MLSDCRETSKVSAAFAASPSELTVAEPKSPPNEGVKKGTCMCTWTVVWLTAAPLEITGVIEQVTVRSFGLRVPSGWLARGSNNKGKGEVRAPKEVVGEGDTERGQPHGLSCSVSLIGFQELVSHLH